MVAGVMYKPFGAATTFEKQHTCTQAEYDTCVELSVGTLPTLLAVSLFGSKVCARLSSPSEQQLPVSVMRLLHPYLHMFGLVLAHIISLVGLRDKVDRSRDEGHKTSPRVRR